MNVELPNNEDGKFNVNIDECYFDVINKPIKAWLIGIFAADGFVRSDGKGIGIAQSGENGLKLIKYIKEELKIKNKICIQKTKYQDSYSIGANSKNIIFNLNNYGIVKNKTVRYKFPWELPDKFYKDFIRGYFEGDGSITISNNSSGYRIFTFSFVGTPDFISSCYDVIPICGAIIRKCSGSNKVKQICWNGKKAIKMCEWLFSTPNLYLSYKYQKYLDYLNFLKKNPPDYWKYDDLKTEASILYNGGLSCMKISKRLGVRFQTIYKWREKGFL